MCNIKTLASLQAAVLEGVVKIDSSDKTDNKPTMQAIESHITEFVNNVDNHTAEALTALKQFEEWVADQRRLLTSNVASAKKHTEAEERRAEVNRKAEAKRSEKEAAAADRKAQAELKKVRKAALLRLSKMLKKPKSPTDGKDDKVKKWAMVGAKTNWATVKKEANRVAREVKKAQKEADAAARKLANAGKPKNAAYSKFCSWFLADVQEIEDAGFENKRDYNKFVWAEGLDGLEYDDWDVFKRSPGAPWNVPK